MLGGKQQSFKFLYDVNNNRLDKDDNKMISFNVSSKDELYQKYSVIVAIWASTLSILVSTISLLISLFFPQKIIIELPKNNSTITTSIVILWSILSV